MKKINPNKGRNILNLVADKLFVILLLASVLIGMLAAFPVRAEMWNIETVDAGGIVGWYPSIAIDKNDNPKISYYDNINASLKYAEFNGVSWNIQTLDSGGGDVGYYTSLALDSYNFPSISYYDYTHGDLKYAYWNGTTWIRRIEDSAGGTFTSLALDKNNNPKISYYDESNGDLKYLNWTGAIKNITVVDSTGIVGKSTSLALDSNGFPCISYYDESNGYLKYSKWNGTTWSNQMVDSVGNTGSFTSLALDKNNSPHISYYDGNNKDLKYAIWNGSTWNITVVDFSGNVGQSTSLALDSHDFPHIGYYDATNGDLKYAKWTGSAWNIMNVDSGGDVGFYLSLAIDSDDIPHISYYDRTNKSLKYAKATTSTPLQAWGDNSFGQLGNGRTIDKSTPAQVKNLSGIITIGAGFYHSIALRNNRTVWTWGANDYGQLGDGSFTQNSSPVQVKGLSNILAIAGGGFHTIALKGDGTVWTWGANDYGQLGDGSLTQNSTPVQVKGLPNILAIAGGGYQTIALKDDGTAWTWGANDYGQLGDGSLTQNSTPVQVKGLSNLVAIAGGGFHTIALKGDGTVWTWGRNDYGQLGDGSLTQNSTPVQVKGLSNITAIAGGGFHTIALKGDGTVWTWGANDYGQLGDGSLTQNSTPVQVKGLSNITAIAGGGYHNIALKSDGTIWTWGANDNGQLGIGTSDFAPHPIPVQMKGISKMTAITAGLSHSIAMKELNITGVVAAPKTNSAVITWTTSIASNSLVKFGFDTGSLYTIASDIAYSTAHSITLTGLSTNTKYFYLVNSADETGYNEESDAFSFTTLSQSNGGNPGGGSPSGGGGGGGGGGGTSGENFTNIEVKEKYDLFIYKDKTTQYRFTNSTNPVIFVNITGNTNAGEINTMVEVLRNTSVYAKNNSAPGIVYKNFNIWVGTSGFGTSKNIQAGVIGFRIENSWLDTRGISGSDIKLVKWDGSKWIELETREKSKDADFDYFDAATTSFSPFAITSIKSVPSPQAVQPGITPVVTTAAVPPSENPPKGPTMNFWLISGVFAILMLGGSTSYLWVKSSLKIVLEQTSVQADGRSTLPLKVQFVNGFGQIIKYPQDKDVNIMAVSGMIENVVIHADKGFAEAVLTSSKECGPVTITAISDKKKATAHVTFEVKGTGVCIHCGKEVHEGEKFCENCGKPLRAGKINQQKLFMIRWTFLS